LAITAAVGTPSIVNWRCPRNGAKARMPNIAGTAATPSHPHEQILPKRPDG